MSIILLHHLLQSFLLPPLNSIIIICIGLLIKSYKLKKTGNSFLITGITLIYLQSTPFFVYALSGFIEQPQISQQNLEKAQALIVLGGGIRTNAYEYPEKYAPNSYTLVRLQYAAFLANQYPDKPIIVTGGIASPNNHSEAEIMENTLKNTFKVINPILVEEQSRTTEENAKFVAIILQQLNYTNVAIISQAYHTKRAKALFKKYGINAIPAPTDYMGHYSRKVTLANFIPDAGTMAECSSLLHEILGYLYYIA